MYAITGITGKVGGELARTLLARGEPVRAVVRDVGKGEAWAALGCEVAVAAMEDPSALAAAFAGASAAFVLLPPVFDPTPGYPETRRVIDSVVDALRTAAPDRVLCLSTIGGDATRDNLLSQLTMLERAVTALDLPVTILRPSWFLENALWDVPTARDAGVIHSFLQPSDKHFPMVATRDVGRVAADLIVEAWKGTRVVEVEGPRRVSHVISVAQYLMGEVEAVAAQAQTFFPTRPVPSGGSGYGAVAGADAPRAVVENEDQIQALVRFAGGAGGTIEASRVAAGKVFGVYWEVSGTEGTIVMDGERFNELQVSRFNDPKPDRGFKTILCGSQVPQYGAFFGFDFAGGGLGYFDVKVIEVRDLIAGLCEDGDCFPNFDFGLANQRVIDAMERSLESGGWAAVAGAARV